MIEPLFYGQFILWLVYLHGHRYGLGCLIPKLSQMATLHCEGLFTLYPFKRQGPVPGPGSIFVCVNRSYLTIASLLRSENLLHFVPLFPIIFSVLYGGFTLPYTDTDNIANIELCWSVHTAQRDARGLIWFCVGLCFILSVRQCEPTIRARLHSGSVSIQSHHCRGTSNIDRIENNGNK